MVYFPLSTININQIVGKYTIHVFYGIYIYIHMYIYDMKKCVYIQILGFSPRG